MRRCKASTRNLSSPNPWHHPHTQKMAGGGDIQPHLQPHAVCWLVTKRRRAASTVPQMEPECQFFSAPANPGSWMAHQRLRAVVARPVYGAERLTLGGESSVRALKNSICPATTAAIRAMNSATPLFTLPVIGQVSATVAFDGGWLEKDREDRFTSGTLWGASVGLSSSGPCLATRFQWVHRCITLTGLAGSRQSAA